MRRRLPVVPGQLSPAERTGKANDPAVRITDGGTRWRKGVRRCGRCGREGVRVVQSWGEKQTAWYYGAHEVPTDRQNGGQS